jgi:hypothetical protein
MAERVVVVCDVCGEPAQETVTIRVGATGHVKDLCASPRPRGAVPRAAAAAATE